LNFNRLISLLLLIAFYSPAWDLGTIWAPFTAKAPQTQAIKETPRTRKNVVFMRVSGVFQSLNRPEIILCKRELFYYFLIRKETSSFPDRRILSETTSILGLGRRDLYGHGDDHRLQTQIST
jgi:hypothetical protein